ncbi:peptidoglycan-binding domain-containing protein [Patulibacter defluvii]|uniref:peptidoglycan-binding domain-containing protein n=1 Tax=Patulibacter defluvii TaxID=3095358 RepID=UPI002A7643CA|nr:peptidoglycan-binding domain-containing protein [Patulibacter sp. DM4]
MALSSTGLGMVAVPAAQASRVQQRLVHEGFLSASDVSGRYDPRTGAAVARWQAARGLRADGIVDSATAERLLGIPHTRRTR